MSKHGCFVPRVLLKSSRIPFKAYRRVPGLFSSIEIMYIFTSGSRVSEKELTITTDTQNTLITTATVMSLHSTWGVLIAKDHKVKTADDFHRL